MTFELRPSNSEAFAERLRSAEARRNQELANPCRRPRQTDMAVAKRQMGSGRTARDAPH